MREQKRERSARVRIDGLGASRGVGSSWSNNFSDSFASDLATFQLLFFFGFGSVSGSFVFSCNVNVLKPRLGVLKWRAQALSGDR